MPRFKNIHAEGQVNDVDMMTRHLAATDWFMTEPGLINGIEGRILQLPQTKASLLCWTTVNEQHPETDRCRLSQNARNCFLFSTISSSIKWLCLLLLPFKEVHNKTKRCPSVRNIIRFSEYSRKNEYLYLGCWHNFLEFSEKILKDTNNNNDCFFYVNVQ